MRTGLLLLCLGLCALVVVQWIRESALRQELSGMVSILRVSEDTASELAGRGRALEEEIRRLMEARAEAVAKRDELVAETARLTVLLEEQAAAVPPDYAEILKARNTEVAGQNEVILRQNAALRELVRERDGLATRLNAMTRDYNEVVRKKNQGGG